MSAAPHSEERGKERCGSCISGLAPARQGEPPTIEPCPSCDGEWAVDAYLVAVTVLGADESAQEALFDLLADVAYSWGERHNLEIFCAGRPAPEAHRSDCPVAGLSGSPEGDDR